MKKIYISSITCSHCESKVRKALEEIGGTNIKVDLENKFVTVDTDKSNEDIIEAISDYGFDVDNIE